MDGPRCEFCRKFLAVFKCLDCKQIFCSGCCLHTTRNPGSNRWEAGGAGDAREFFKVCPLCKSDHVVDRLEQNPYEAPRESSNEPKKSWMIVAAEIVLVVLIVATAGWM